MLDDLAELASQVNSGADVGASGTAMVLRSAGGAAPPELPAQPKPRPLAQYLWAALIARI